MYRFLADLTAQGVPKTGHSSQRDQAKCRTQPSVQQSSYCKSKILASVLYQLDFCRSSEDSRLGSLRSRSFTIQRIFVYNHVCMYSMIVCTCKQEFDQSIVEHGKDKTKHVLESTGWAGPGPFQLNLLIDWWMDQFVLDVFVLSKLLFSGPRGPITDLIVLRLYVKSMVHRRCLNYSSGISRDYTKESFQAKCSHRWQNNSVNSTRSRNTRLRFGSNAVSISTRQQEADRCELYWSR